MNASNFFVLLFFVGLSIVIWIGLTSQGRRTKEFERATQRLSAHGPFAVVYECLNQVVASNASSEWFIVVDAKFRALDKDGRIVATYDRSVGFHKSKILRIGRGTVVDTTEPKSASSLSYYELLLDGPNDVSLSPITLRLSGYCFEIDPWVLRTFKFQSNEPSSYSDYI
jgi:hypothetical protein